MVINKHVRLISMRHLMLALYDAFLHQISIEVDSDRTFLDTLTMSLVPRHIFQRHCKLIDTSQRVTGTVTVESPPNKRVSEPIIDRTTSILLLARSCFLYVRNWRTNTWISSSHLLSTGLGHPGCGEWPGWPGMRQPNLHVSSSTYIHQLCAAFLGISIYKCVFLLFSYGSLLLWPRAEWISTTTTFEIDLCWNLMDQFKQVLF